MAFPKLDVGYSFTYTGSGGRDLSGELWSNSLRFLSFKAHSDCSLGTSAAPKNLRVALQTFDQVFNKLNAALQISSQTGKSSKPVYYLFHGRSVGNISSQYESSEGTKPPVLSHPRAATGTMVYTNANEPGWKLERQATKSVDSPS